jgi:anti-anti-sigma factor
MVKADVIEALGRELRRAIDGSHAQHFVLDLAVVRYMTSAALGMIINLRAHLADRGYTLALAGATGEVAHIFECTRLADVLPVFPSADAAVHNLADPCADCDI